MWMVCCYVFYQESCRQIDAYAWSFFPAGQREILDDLLVFAETRLIGAIESARGLGIEISLEPDEYNSE